MGNYFNRTFDTEICQNYEPVAIRRIQHNKPFKIEICQNYNQLQSDGYIKIRSILFFPARRFGPKPFQCHAILIPCHICSLKFRSFYTITQILILIQFIIVNFRCSYYNSNCKNALPTSYKNSFFIKTVFFNLQNLKLIGFLDSVSHIQENFSILLERKQ